MTEQEKSERDLQLIRAFVDRVRWWEFTQEGATLWPEDRNIAESEAEKRLARGNLGKVKGIK